MTKALKQQKRMHSLKHYSLLGMNIIDPIKKSRIAPTALLLKDKLQTHSPAGQNKQKTKQIFAYLHENKHLMQFRAATLKLMLWFRVL